MKITRRNLLVSSLFGAGYVGLRALATGVPAAFLLKGHKAFADGSMPTCADASKAQYIIMSTSVLAKQLAPCLNTVQTQPITLGATSPSEGLSFGGAPLPILPPLALQSTLTMPNGPLANLVGVRDQTLSKLDDLYRGGATPAQK